MDTSKQSPISPVSSPSAIDQDQRPPNLPPSKRRGIPISLIIIFLVVAFICGLLIAAWYFQTQLQKNNSTTLSPGPSAAAHIDKIIVGTDPTLQPMEYIAEGKFVGYDIDLANSLGKELGAKVEFKNIVFDNLFTALEQKKIDMIISAVTITEERKQKYKFSDPYLNAGQVIIGKIDDDSVKSTADLKGKKIAVQKGTTNEESALKYTASNLVIRYPDFEQATQALVDGKVDAIFTDLPSAKGITVTNPTLKIASDPFTDEYYGIVFRKDESMVKQVNDALTSLRIKGTLTDLKQKWLD